MQNGMRVIQASGLMLWAAATFGVPETGRAQQEPAVRPLGPIVATVQGVLGAVVWVRPLSDGRILVNDASHRRVLLYDSTLSDPIVVMDSSGALVRAYGARPGGLHAFLGDSSLFVDPVALAFVVIDPNGRAVRTMALPSPDAASTLTLVNLTRPGIDSRGRMIYRGSGNPLATPSDGSAAIPPPFPTGPLVRFDLTTRVLDTAALVRISSAIPPVTTGTETDRTIRTIQNPLINIDGWTVLRDGTLAIVRDQDYHVDWIAPDGKITSSPKIPHQWVRLTDEDKAYLLDSVRKVIAADPSSSSTVTNGMGVKITRITDVVDPSELPDYFPPIKANTIRGDFDSNLWIPPQALHPVPGGPVYDVLSRRGELIDRVQIPGGCTVVGFGPGVVFLTSREGTGLTLARARIR